MSSDSRVHTPPPVPVLRRILSSPWVYGLIALVLGMVAGSVFS